MTHTWLGPNHRRSLWRTSDAGAEWLGVVTDLGVGWIAVAGATPLGILPTRDEAGRVLCEHLGIGMPGFDSGEAGDDF